jgi:dephospho-CoA kinase
MTSEQTTALDRSRGDSPGGARLIGITGGFGAGKSAVSALIAERHPVLDSDRIARALMEEDADLRRAIAGRFGEDVFDPPGAPERPALNRAVLAARVFADPAELDALNRLVHPVVMRAVTAQAAAHATAGRTIVFVESAIIYEAGLEDAFALVIAVLASEATVLARLRAGARFSEEDARRRIARQMNPEEKASRADIVIRNEGSVDDLRARVALALRIVEALCRRG